MFRNPKHLNKLLEMEALSPSGKFKLIISKIKTGEKTWDYTSCDIYNSDKYICNITRNYPTFHHSFIAYRGEEYLVTGRKYIGITIISLETGKEWNCDKVDGGFCSTSFHLTPDEKTLIVNGCYWGCPYECHFYNFDLDSFDPDKGFKSLKIISDYPPRLEYESFTFDNGLIYYDREEEYNYRLLDWQEDLEFYPNTWLEILGPKDDLLDLLSLSMDEDNYYRKVEALYNKYKQELERDVLMVNKEEVVLERKEDEIHVLRLIELDDETGNFISRV